MTSTKWLGVAVAALSLLVPSTASAASAKSCGDSTPHGITGVRATGVSCTTAKKVAQNYNVSKVDRRRLNGWRCRGQRISSTREKVSCTKDGRRVTFRSTYQIELPAAPAPPNVNASS